MRHFGLIDETKLAEADFTLQQARLHLRAGKYRFRHGKLAAGIAAVYDALVYAMRWYITTPEHRKRLGLEEAQELADDRALFLLLNHAGILDGSFDFDAFETFVDEALACEIYSFAPNEIFAEIEKVMFQLGVLPFDEASLPSVNPAPK